MIYNKIFFGFNGFNIKMVKNEKVYKNLPLEWSKSTNTIDIKQNVLIPQAILAGKKNNLMVIDFDLFASYIAFTEKYQFLQNTLMVKTKRGYHLYFQYDSRFKSNTDCFKSYKKIDIISDGKFITAPNTFYFDENNKKCIYEIIENKDFLKLNDEQVNLILGEIKESTSINNINNNTLNNNKMVSSTQEIQEIANNIKLDYLDNYNDWIKIVWSLASIEEYGLSVEISKKSNKFDIEQHDKIYKQKNNERIGIGTLYYYSKLSNSKKFNNIKNKYLIESSSVSLDEKIDKTDYVLAELYLKLNQDNLIYFENYIYYYADPFWKKDEKNSFTMYNFRDLVSRFLTKKSKYLYSKIDDDNKTSILEEMSFISKITDSINTYTKQESVIKQVINLLTVRSEITENIFDVKRPNVFCFKNKFFDVVEKKEVDICKTDYITINSGYNYIEPTEKEYEIIDSIIRDIMPTEAEYECLMSILKNCLTTVQAKKFIFFNGEGSNGKGWLLEFMEQLLGNNHYFVRADKSMLVCKTSKGASAEIAALNKKRLCLYSEPEEDERLNAGVLKEITDTPTKQARGLYKNLETVYLQGAFIVECNKKPKIKGRADQALLRRIIDLYFPTIFKDKQEDCIDINDKLKKEEYKEHSFILQYRFALFKYIMDKGKNSIYVPKSVQDRSTKYVLNNDELINWFDDGYEITNDINDIMTIKEIYSCFKTSEFYKKMDKDERRTMGSKKNFEEAIARHIKFRKIYKDDYRPYINGKQQKFRSCLVGVKQLFDEDDDLGCIISDLDP